jgi:hypothetical protein
LKIADVIDTYDKWLEEYEEASFVFQETLQYENRTSTTLDEYDNSKLLPDFEE